MIVSCGGRRGLLLPDLEGVDTVAQQIDSVGSFGCNLRCPFCQNHEISMCGADEIETAELSPEALADKALELRPYGNIGVAYTYNESLRGIFINSGRSCAE